MPHRAIDYPDSHPQEPPGRAFSLIELLVCMVIIGLLLGLVFAAVHQSRHAALEVERKVWLRDRRFGVTGARTLPIRILFIGNSYTGTGNLPQVLKALAEASGAQPPLEVDSQLVGGARLKDHWEQETARNKIASGAWDFVVLQEQSQTPLPQYGRDQYFYPYARLFDQEIRERGAITLFFLTWARPDTPGSQANWTDSYLRIAEELRAEVAPAGMAWQRVREGLPHVTLLADQGGHPTPTGTYLIACTFYAAIYDRNPVGLPSSVTTETGAVSVAPADAERMHGYAWEAVQQAKRKLRPWCSPAP